MVLAPVLAMLLQVDAGSDQPPLDLVCRQTLIQSFVDREHQLWILQVTPSGEAVLEQHLEKVELAPEDLPRGPVEQAAAQGAKLKGTLRYRPSPTTRYEGSVKRSRNGFRGDLRSGAVKVRLACTWVQWKIYPSTARLQLPPGPKPCAEYLLRWVSPTPATTTRVATCQLGGVELPYWGQTLNFGEGPGIEQLTEEDSCTGGEGLRLLAPGDAGVEGLAAP